MATPLHPPPLLPMLLPTGIVENTAEIYAEVASYPVVPPEKICEYWHVYTTTFRKLIDPTASRLENFWWHVWGSDRRNLSGKALAKLYEEISTGPTFMPLYGPPDRFDGTPGPPAPRLSQHELDKHTLVRPREPRQQRQQRQQRRKLATGNADNEASENRSPAQTTERTPSALKPPPPQSILKKPSGSQGSGPKPTARFVSPYHSEDEVPKGDDNAVEETSSGSGSTGSGSTGTSGLEIRARKPAKRRASPTPKRRGVAVRRPGSQSSAGGPSPKSSAGRLSPEASARSPSPQTFPKRPRSRSSRHASPKAALVGSSYARSDGERRLATLNTGELQTITPIPEHPVGEMAVAVAAAAAAEQSDAESPPPVLSAKAAGKRPDIGSLPNRQRPASNRQRPATSRLGSTQEEGQQHPVAMQQADAPEPVSLPFRTRPSEGTRGGAKAPRLPRSRSDLFQGRRTAAPSGGALPPRMTRTQSQADHIPRVKEESSGRLPAQGLVASTVAATSNVAAQGQINSETEIADPPKPATLTLLGPALPLSKDTAPAVGSRIGGARPLDPLSTPLLEPVFTPTAPNTHTPLPFGRTRSQLTLLLERDKARTAASSGGNGVDKEEEEREER